MSDQSQERTYRQALIGIAAILILALVYLTLGLVALGWPN